ncbi:MAG TPA: AAA family ATPase [Armatimonadota bacterium]|nr:AAA family ATPase [Armatimonadota bacterium]
MSVEAPNARASLEQMFAHLRSGEERPATILMSDVTGFSALSSNAEPEWVFNLINEVLAELVECLIGHGAHIDNYVGDEVVALFGVPRAQERSVERALLAALAMQDRMRALNDEGRFGQVELQIHTGINVGRVMVGPIGHGAHTDYTVIGDAVNLAKRLEDQAPPGETYVTRAVQEAVGEGFQFEEIGPLPGVEREIEVLRLTGADQAKLSQRGILTKYLPGIARTEEMQRLTDHADSVRQGASKTVAVIGPPGIGKSHLINDWRSSASASGFQTVTTTCHACGAYFPLLPLADVIARLIGLQLRGWPPSVVGDGSAALSQTGISTDSAELLAQVLHLVARVPEHDLEDLPARLAEALAKLLSVLSADRPLCVIIEDINWLDDASEAVLKELVDALQGPVLLIVSARDPKPGWLAEVDVPEIRLQRLPRQVMRQLVEDWAGSERLPRSTIEAICNRADGNPHFARELVRCLHGAPGDWSDEGVGFPENLQELFLSQLDRLALPVRRVVQAASIVGEPLSLDILPAVLGDTPLPDNTIHRVIREGLLQPGTAADQFVFGRRLLFDVAYNTIPPSQRRELHRRAADHLMARMDEDGEALVHAAAYHAYLGYSDAQAINLLLRSATVYKAQYSLRGSIQAALRAIELMASLQDAGSFLDSRLEALLLLAQCHQVSGNLDEAEASIAEAEVLAEECANAELRGKVLTASGTLSLMRGEPDSAESRYAGALAIWQSLDNPTRVAHMVVGIGLCASQRGDRGRAVELFAQAADTAGAADWIRAAAENNLGVMLIEEGRYEEAEPHLLRGLGANERDADRRGIAQSKCSLGELYYRLARLDEAQQALTEAAAEAEETEDALCLAQAQAWLMRVSSLREEVADLDYAGRELCEQVSPEVAAVTRIARADCTFSRGEDGETRELLSELVAEGAPAGNNGVELLTLGLEAALLRDDSETALQLAGMLRAALDKAVDRHLRAYAEWLLSRTEGAPAEYATVDDAPRTCFDLRAERVATGLM